MKKNKQNERNPLAEVFGRLTIDQSEEAKRLRSRRLCPFNNKIPNCTKDKAKNPLGVCSVNFGKSPVVTCPVRFKESWLMTDDAADFFFPRGAKWTTLTEIRLNDSNGKTAGNIDVVLVAYDERGKVYDFGAIEIQAVYISGNVRDPFEEFMKNPEKNANLDWSEGVNYPRPDYLSSSRKRLAPQLLFKGGILNEWNKKTAVVLNRSFFKTLPEIKRVAKERANLAWLLYDLVLIGGVYKLKRVDTIYSSFLPTMNIITKTKAGNINSFVKILQEKVDEQMETPPVNRTLEDFLIK